MTKHGPWDDDPMWVPDVEPGDIPDEDTQPKLSDLADAIIEGYWILCEPAEVVGRAIEEFVAYRDKGLPFLYNDAPVSADELMTALDEVVTHFQERKIWPTEETHRPIIEMETK